MNAYQIIAIFVIVLGVVCDFIRVAGNLKRANASQASAVLATLMVVVSAGALPLVLYLGGFFK